MWPMGHVERTVCGLPTQKHPAKQMHKLVPLGFASRQVCKLVGIGGDACMHAHAHTQHV